MEENKSNSYMSNKIFQAYFFFTANSSSPPDLVYLTLNYAKAIFPNITVVTNNNFKSILQGKYPGFNVLDAEGFSTYKEERKYIELINNGVISSNYPPVEQLCLKRWLIMKELFNLGTLDKTRPAVVFDWDTILFSPLLKITKKFTNKISNSEIPFASGFFELGLKTGLINNWLPIYDVCPNLIFLNFKALEIYCRCMDLLLSKKKNLQSIYKNRYFNDMSIWSMAISTINREYPNNFLYDLDQISLESNIFCDHNIRIDWQGELNFLMKIHSIPEQFDYTGTGKLPIKKISINQDQIPEVRLLSGEKIELACAHFSGVEAKYVLMSELHKNGKFLP